MQHLLLLFCAVKYMSLQNSSDIKELKESLGKKVDKEIFKMKVEMLEEKHQDLKKDVSKHNDKIDEMSQTLIDTTGEMQRMFEKMMDRRGD